MKTANINSNTLEQIVITLNSCGHNEHYYVSVPASMSGSMITKYVYASYGRESGQQWRPATPSERENKQFETADVPAQFMSTDNFSSVLEDGFEGECEADRYFYDQI